MSKYDYSVHIWEHRGDWYANVKLTDTFGKEMGLLENGIGPDRIEDVVLDAVKIITEHKEANA